MHEHKDVNCSVREAAVQAEVSLVAASLAVVHSSSFEALQMDGTGDDLNGFEDNDAGLGRGPRSETVRSGGEEEQGG